MHCPVLGSTVYALGVAGLQKWSHQAGHAGVKPKSTVYAGAYYEYCTENDLSWLGVYSAMQLLEEVPDSIHGYEVLLFIGRTYFLWF